MKQFKRYTIRIAGALLCLLFLVWLGLVVFVQLNRKALLQRATSELNARLAGSVYVGGLDISFFRHWPDISVRLAAVSVRDSAWQRHRRDLLNATAIYLTCSLWKSLRSFSVQPGSIEIEHGQIYFFTDSAGYSNSWALQIRGSGRTGKSSVYPDLTFHDVRVVLENQYKHKLFDLDVRHLACAIELQERSLLFHVSAGNIHVGSFAFNTEKGSFLKDKTLSGNFTIQYNPASKILQFNRAKVMIDGISFSLSGRFFPTVSPDPFFLTVETDHVLYRQATAMLTPNLQQALDQYDIDKPFAVKVQLDAGAADDPTPQIQVRLNLSNSNVGTPVGRFTGVSFNGSFINESARGEKRGDENSGIRLLFFTGNILDIPLRADSVAIVNLKHPRMSCDLHSQFALGSLNDLTGSQTLRFTGGTGSMNITYKGPLSENDTAGTLVNGSLDIDSASLLYLPCGFRFSEGKGRLLFRDRDLTTDQLKLRAGSTKIQVRGIARNLVALLDKNAENISMNWNVSTTRLDLEDLMPLAERPAPQTGNVGATAGTTSRRSEGPLFGKTFARIDRLLKEGAIHVSIEAADLHFRKFSGAHAKADLLFDNHSIRLNDLGIAQGAGSIHLKALLSRQAPGDASPLSLESHLEQVDLSPLFAAFNNFGQDALTSANLKGRITADIRMEGALTGKAKIVPGSLKGNVDFIIRNGELVDFAPMEKIKVLFLKNRDLSMVRFAELKNRLDVDSTTVTIHRMEINSSAFTLFVEGTYDLRSGADVGLQVPLSNFSDKRYQVIPPQSRGNEGKAGPSIHLRARTGSDGKLKISWDPFNKALKKARY